jgi:hypothetical protein
MTNEDVSHQNSPIGQSQKLVSTKDKTNLMNEHILLIMTKCLATSFKSEDL